MEEWIPKQRIIERIIEHSRTERCETRNDNGVRLRINIFHPQKYPKIYNEGSQQEKLNNRRNKF